MYIINNKIFYFFIKIYFIFFKKKKILTLLRMCLRVQKHFFVCSWAMQAIVFLCASDIEKNIKIINGNGSKFLNLK